MVSLIDGLAARLPRTLPRLLDQLPVLVSQVRLKDSGDLPTQYPHGSWARPVSRSDPRRLWPKKLDSARLDLLPAVSRMKSGKVETVGLGSYQWKEWEFGRAWGCWLPCLLRASVSCVLFSPRDGSLPGCTPELLFGTCDKAVVGLVSGSMPSQKKDDRVHRLTGLPLLISRSHLLFRPRQLRHARYARIGSTTGGRTGTPAIGALPITALSPLGLGVSLASAPLSTSECGGGAAIAELRGAGIEGIKDRQLTVTRRVTTHT